MSIDTEVGTKTRFIRTINKTMTEMGLKTIKTGIDYSSPLPEIVAIYSDKEKYYLIEPLSYECFSENSPRTNKRDANLEIRQYCKKLFKDDFETANVVATILCDVTASVEMFTYKVVGTHELISMTKYASLAIPCEYEPTVKKALDYLKLEFRTLNVIDKFTLVLIDRVQTAKLPEMKKFIKFILGNK